MEAVAGKINHKAAAHVLIIPVPAAGHIASLLRLAIELARRGITITFVSSEDSISRLTSADGEGSSSELQGLDFRFVGLRSPEGQDREGFQKFLAEGFEVAFRPLKEKWIHDKSVGIIGGPTSIISDMFLPWTQDAADDLQIPKYMFVTSGLIFARFLQGCLPFRENGQFQSSETDGKLLAFDWPVCIAGIPPLHYHELPTSLRRDPSEWLRRSKSVGPSAGILVNSFFELEDKVMESWGSGENPGSEHIQAPKVYPVGPLFSPSAAFASRGLEDSASKCLFWLGSQPPSSSLYVAFGSSVFLGAEQIHELALGLEDSRQRFLWVLPLSKGGSEDETPSSITGVLPPGFEARVGDRGCIVTGWAPQLQILAHSATGGFLTHSGWNSSLESIVSGVPMISWPHQAEQHLNSKYLADDLKIAVRLQTGPENRVKRIEVERVVRLLMVEEEGKPIRRRVEEFQRKAAAAVADGGSQSRVLLEFVDAVLQYEPSPNPGSK